MEAKPRTWLRHLKWIGVLLFAWILWQVDRAQFLACIRSADPLLLIAAFGTLLFSYVVKAVRWHVLVRAAGIRPSLHDSWRLYAIGIFLGNLTPANLGELGRVPYLRRHGMGTRTAVFMVACDRCMDVLVMGLIGLWSIGILWGALWFASAVAAGAITLLAVIGVFFFSRRTAIFRWLEAFGKADLLWTLLMLLILSVCIWILYFVWTILLARALGIVLPVPVLTAALTITGIVALLPIAPAGLGTRDSALLALLTPYGVAHAQVVALTLLMFTFIMASSVVGLWYWLREQRAA